MVRELAAPPVRGTLYANTKTTERVVVSLPPFQAAHNRAVGARHDARELPLFDVPEAAQFVGIPSAALAEWMRPGRDSEPPAPLLQPADPSCTRLSFANLVEAHILEATRQHHVSSSDVRIAIDVVRKRGRGTPHPLLAREFHNKGKGEFLDRLASNAGAVRDVNGRAIRLHRLALDLDRYLERIDRDRNDDPYQLFPMRHNQRRYVALNIGLSAGHPVIAGTGLRVRHLSDLISTGMSASSVASHYGLNENTVAGAVAFLAA
jgi:uncharacterized protein (DUF433 family)